MFKMKNVIKVAIIGVAFLALTGTRTMAQSKLGHINFGLLVSMMPEAKDAQKKLDDYFTALQDQFKTMQTEFQTKYTDYQSKAKTMSDATKSVTEKSLSDLQNRIQQFQQDAQQQGQQKQAEVMQPVRDKAQAAIQAVCKEDKISYVFDTSSGVLIVFPDSDDILPLVKKKLGITAPTPTAASLQGPAGAPAAGK